MAGAVAGKTDDAGTGKVMRLKDALRAGARLHRAGDLAGARAHYRAVLEKVPDHAQALHLMGVAAHQEGRSEEAIGLIDRAIEQRPTSAEFHRNRANVLASLQRYEPALAAAERALALAPADAETLANLANILRGLNRYDEGAGLVWH